MMQETLITSNEFGEGNFGKRLDYSRPKYRDPIFAILYILHVIVVLGAGTYLWITEYPKIKDITNNNNNHSTTTLSPYDDGGDDWSDFDPAGVMVGVFACMIVGTLFGVCWLQVMKKFAGVVIKGMLILNIAVWIIVGVVGLLTPYGLSLIIIGFAMAAFWGLYTWCIWRRIPFATVLLSISATIISKYQGTIIISLAVVLFNILWIFIWISCAAAYYITAAGNETTTCDEYDECTTTGGPNNFVLFLLLISFYWGIQVNRNVSHTTTCGVAATWYFSTVIDHKPTPAAFKRTMTTSFGSVCLGSLIVAILQALRAILKSQRNSRNILSLLAICLLRCIERLIRYFNKYAYAQCAIYGTSFIQSAKATWNLFMTRGLLAIINDDLTGLAISCGAIIGGIVSAAAGWGIGYSFYSDANSDIYPTVPIILAVYGFFIGFAFCSVVLMVLASCVIALFVCYAEDPAAMNQNRPEEYNRLTDAKPTWGDVYRTYGGAAAPPPVGPTMNVQPAQPVVYVQGQPPQTQGQQVMYVQPQQQGQVVYAQQPPQTQQVIYAQPQQQQQVVYAQPPQEGTGGNTAM